MSIHGFSLYCVVRRLLPLFTFFFFNDTATTEIYTLSLHDALPIYIKDLTYTGRSAMPSDYGTILSSGELDDLVSYLLWTSRSASVRKAQSNREDRDEE